MHCHLVEIERRGGPLLEIFTKSKTSELLSLGKTCGNLTRGKNGAKSSLSSLSQTSRRFVSRRRVNVVTDVAIVAASGSEKIFSDQLTHLNGGSKMQL